MSWEATGAAAPTKTRDLPVRLVKVAVKARYCSGARCAALSSRPVLFQSAHCPRLAFKRLPLGLPAQQTHLWQHYIPPAGTEAPSRLPAACWRHTCEALHARGRVRTRPPVDMRPQARRTPGHRRAGALAEPCAPRCVLLHQRVAVSAGAPCARQGATQQALRCGLQHAHTPPHQHP